MSLKEINVKISADSSNFKKGVSEAEKALQDAFKKDYLSDLNKQLMSTSETISGLIGKAQAFTAVLAGGFGFVALVKGTTESAAATKKLADSYGMTIKEAAHFKTVIGMTGGEVEGTIKQLAKLQDNVDSMSKATEGTRQMLDLLGVSFRDADGNLLPYEERLANLAAGYKKAKEAGEGEMFIMQTLGAKGMALISVLEKLEEKRNILAQRKSVGLDIERSAELNKKIELLELQAAQIKTAFGEVFIPLAEVIVPKVVNELQYLAEVYKENKERIFEVTEAITKMIAAYAAFKTAIAVQGALNGAISSASQMFGFSKSAAQLAEEEAIKQKQLASDEKFIAQREAMYQSSATKRMKAEFDRLQKELQQGKITEAEFNKLYAERTIKIQQECNKQKEIFRQTMQEQIRLAREGQAQVSQSEQQKANAAKAASTQIQAANTQAAASAQKIVTANQAAGNSARIMASTMTTQIGKVGTFISGNFLPIIALIGTTWLMSGNNATTATDEMATGSQSAISSVGALTAAVIALGNGWLFAAAAFAAYALGKTLADGMEERKKETYEIDGAQYHWDKKNGKLTKVVETQESKDADSVNNMTQYYGDYFNGRKKEVEIKEGTYDWKLFQNHWWEKHKNDKDYQEQLAAEAAEAAAKEAEEATKKAHEDLRNNMKNIAASAGGGGSAGKVAKAAKEANKIITETITRTVADSILDVSKMYDPYLGSQWTPWQYGFTDRTKYTDNLREQCDSFTADFYATYFKKLGINNPFSGVVNDADFKALGAYDSNPYAIPEIGDLIDGLTHVGIYIGNNLVRHRSSSGGLVDTPLEEWKQTHHFQGIGRIRQIPGVKDIQETITGTREQIDAIKKGLKSYEDIVKAQDELLKLTREIKAEYISLDATEYSKKEIEIYNSLAEKQDKINELKNKGADISEAQIALDTLKNRKLSELNREYEKNIKNAQTSLDISKGELNNNYFDIAYAKYYKTIAEAEEKRIETVKQLGKTQDDVTANAIANTQKEIEVKKALAEFEKNLLSATSQRLDKLAEEGKLLTIMAEEASSAFDLVNESAHRGNVRLSQMYVEMLKSVHLSATEMMANTVADLTDSASSGLAAFIQGTKSAGDAFREMGQSILKTMSEIIAKAIVMKALGGIFNSLFSGFGGSSYNAGLVSNAGFGVDMSGFDMGTTFTMPTNNWGFTPFKPKLFAEGGIVTAPTMAMIGEAGNNEAVIPLTDKNLAALGGGKAPSVRVNIMNNTGDEAKATENDISWDEQMQEYVVNVVLDRTERNVGGFRTSMKGLLNS